MTLNGLALTELDQSTEWARRSLSVGSQLAQFVIDRLHEFVVACTIVPSASSSLDLSLDDHGRGISLEDADQEAARVFKGFERSGASTLIVEDDLARRGDSGLLTSNVVFIGDRVLRWVRLDGAPAAASRLLRGGSSGYPLNAFVSTGSPETLGLCPGRELAESETLRLASTVSALVMSVWDAESYLLLAAPQLAPTISTS